VKPANIMLGAQDLVTLTDFGLVKAADRRKITGAGVTIGTLKYMSPEQAAGKELDSRSDIYSLGVVVYEMLAGQAPFTGTTPYQTLHELIYQPPPPLSRLNPQVDPRVERVVLRALTKEPDERFGRACEFAAALAAATGVEPSARARDSAERTGREVVLRLIGADGREFPVYRGNTDVGRDAGNAIVIPVRQVSRHHLRIHCGPEGCTVVDKGSTNGTFVNGVRIPIDMPTPLAAEDVLEIGPVQLLVARSSSLDTGIDWKTTLMERKVD